MSLRRRLTKCGCSSSTAALCYGVWRGGGRLLPVSAALADPHRYVGGFQGLVHDTGQVSPDRVQVHGVFQPGRERGHSLVGVVAGPVEPPVDRKSTRLNSSHMSISYAVFCL